MARIYCLVVTYMLLSYYKEFRESFSDDLIKYNNLLSFEVDQAYKNICAGHVLNIPLVEFSFFIYTCTNLRSWKWTKPMNYAYWSMSTAALVLLMQLFQLIVDWHGKPIIIRLIHIYTFYTLLIMFRT